MATDTTTNQTETANNTSTIHESDVEQVHLTQSGTPVQVQVPQGENVVRVQVTPGETIQLPFPTDGLVARLGDNGNLAVKVGDVTVILLGYAEATGQAEVTILGSNNQPLDVAAVLASTDPNLDIQTAAGPGAGDAGTGVDNNGGVFSPFDPNAGIGGLNAIGGLDPTLLNYNLIQREFIEIIEADETEADTTPTVVNITQAPPVNEDDLNGPRCDHDLIDRLTPDRDPEPEGEQPALQSFSEKGGEPKWVLAHEYEEGNDPFDTDDHEEGSQTDFDGDGKSEFEPIISDNGFLGVDRDREPLSVTATVEANFFGDLPGKLVLDVNGNGINDGAGDVPLIDQLLAMGLTSHGHELTYDLLPAIPESAPGANDGTGQMVVAYYTVIKYGCPTNVVVFTIGVDDDVVNTGETNPAGNAEFGLTFTIYGVVDHPEKGGGTEEGNGVEDILKIEVPFFLQDSDSPPVPSDFPQPLEFQDIDDMPFLGEVCYVTLCGFEVPIAITKANLTIGHDETPGDQSTWYDSDLQPHAPGWLPDQQTDDVDDGLANYLAWKADKQLDDIADGKTDGKFSGEDVDITYQQDILSQLSNEFLNNGNFCADPLGVAKTYLTVSFGADGKADKNDQAGNTLFQHDNDAGEGTDKSGRTYSSDGTKLNNDADPLNDDDGGTDKRAFELFMKNTNSESATAGEVMDKSATNWTITVMVNGEPTTITVYAFQLDANTIIGMASPSNFEGEPDGPQESFALQGAVGNDYGGIDGEGDAIPVFMLRLDPESGQLVFVQYHQINNPEGGNAAHPDWDQSSNDPIHLYDADGNPLVFFQATDFDGDTVTSQLEVSVIDDAPDAKDDKAVLDEENAGVDGELNKVTGNLVLGVSNDGVNNDNGKDKLSVDHDHTIPALKYGNSTITFDFLADTFNVTGSDATNVTFDGHTVEFDTPHGHFKVVVDGDHSDPNGGDSPLETDELGYYEYTSKPGNNSDKDQYGLETTANGTVDPVGANDSAKILSLLGSFGVLTLSNNAGGVDNNAANWGYKTIDAGGKHYSGIAVGGGIDGGETDTNGSGQVATEVLTVKFPNDVDAAKITVGALFDGQLHDNGNAEALKWEAWDGNTKVGEGVVYGGYDGLVSFFINVGHDFDKVTLAPLDNGAGNNGNNTDFLLVGVKTCDELCISEQLQYKLQDADGDYDTAKLTIDVLDGEPCISTRQADLEITIDEDGLPNGNNNNVNSPSGNVDDNVGGDNGAGDADGKESTAQGHIAYNTYADGLGGVFLSSTSALTTVDGKSITWAWDPSLNRLVGYATPDTDRIVIEVLLSNANDSGVDFKIVMHEPLDHPSNNNEDNLYLDIKVTVTDKDCDIDTANIHVKIDDDVPTVTIQALVTGTVDIDESSNDQWDDTNNNNAPQALKTVSNSGPIIEYAKDGDPVVSVNAHFGADGAATNNAVAYAVSAGAANSGLDFKDSGGTIRDIVLTTENGVVVGRVSGGPDAGKAVFAISIDSNGELEVAQYRPIHHNDTNSNDEWQSILNNALVATVTVTDGDGDKATSSVNIGDMVKFYDDGPSIDNSSSVTLDEDVIPGAGGNHPGGTGDVSPSLFAANGDLNISFGTDGPGAIEISLNGAPPRLTGDGAFLTFTQVGNTLIGHTGNLADPALTVQVNNDGTYTVTLLKPLDHPNGNNENDIDLQFKVKVTDNDGDSDTGTINVKIDDDAPTQIGVSDYTDQNTKEPTNGDNHHGGEYGYLDEDFLPAGNQDKDANDTDDAIGGVKSIALLSGVSVGADGGSLTLGSVNVHGDVDSGLRRSSDGAQITMVTSPDGKTITGYAGGIQDLAHTVFTIKVVGNTVEFELFQALMQDNTNSNPDLNSGDGNEEGEVKFDITVNLTDKDNDTTSTVVKFLVDDDKPQAIDDGILAISAFNVATSGTNLLTNDLLGADQPAKVIGIKLGGESGNYIAVGAGGTDINIKADGTAGLPAIGTLHVNQDGTWTFTQTTSSALSNLTFSYKVEDADRDSDTASFQVDLKNAPPPSFENENVTVDEDGLPGGANPNTTTAQGSGDDVGGHQEGGLPAPASEAISRDGLNVNWNGNVGTIAFTLSNAQLAAILCHNGLTPTTANVSGNGTGNLIVWDGVPNASNKVIEFKVIDAATSVYDVILHSAIKHAAGNQENNVDLQVDVTASNNGGGTTHQVTVRIDDDMPTMGTNTGSGEFHVDETYLAANAGPSNVDIIFPAATLGADGGTVAFSLTGPGGAAFVNGTNSGLVDTLTNSAVLLYKVGNNIEGQIAGGIVVFKVILSGSNMTLDQVRSVVHADPNNPDDTVNANGLVFVTKTVTDNDGDSVSVTLASAIGLNFSDDAPDAVNDSNSVVTLGVAINGNVTTNDSSGADVDTGFPKGKVVTFTIDAIDYAADGSVHNIPGHGTMSMTSTGAYVFTQTDGAGGVMNVTYKLVDGDGDSDTATLAITTVADIAPVNYNDANSGDENTAQQNNVMIILDRSGSMSDDVDPNTPGTQTRLAIAIAAIENLLNKYDQLGDVKVMIVQFATDGQRMDFWGTPADALAYINGNSPSGNFTSYSDALAFGTAGLGDGDGKIPGAPTTVYFLSDGVPTADGANSGTDSNQDHSLTNTQQTNWNTALENAGVSKVYAVGVGPGLSANDGDLADVANPNGNANNTPVGEVIIVTDENGLSAELEGTIGGGDITGNVLTGVDTSGAGDNGVAGAPGTADANGNGANHIYTLSHDGDGSAFDVAFSWDGVSANALSVGGAGTNVSVVGHVVSFDTEFGRMVFNMETGGYTFTPGSVTQTENVVFHYGTKDADGDTDQVNGTDGDAANSIPGGADLVITINNVVAVPAITSIDDNVGSIQGVVPDNGVTDDAVLVLHGTSDAGSLVKVYDGLTFLGNAISDGLGNWTFTTAALANGTDHHFNATATLGNTSAPSGNYDVTIDTTAPTVAVNIVDASQNDNNTSSSVTFIFSEVPVGFSAVDVAAVGGTVTGLIQDLGSDPSGKTWTATFNANDGFDGNATVSVTNGSYTDAAGNLGNFNFDSVPVDRVNPTVTVNIVDAALSDADTSSVVTFVFSEVPSNFTAADISASNGIVSGLTQNLGLDPSGKTYTATFTKTAGVNGVGSVTVANNSYTDAATNNGSGGSDTVTITSVVNQAPIGGMQHIYTNSDDDVLVQASWLLATASDSDGPLPVTISNVNENTNLINNINDSGLPTSFTFNLSNNDTQDGSVADFDYDMTDSKATTNVDGKIHLDTNGAIDGGITDDVVIGSGGNETLIGNGGIDILIGNGGNDTLVFDASDKLVDGGSGFDRVQTGEASFAFDNVAAGGAKFAGVEMVDLGDTGNHDRTVTINAADVLSTTNVTVDTNSTGGTTNHDIDLFVIGDADNAGGSDDNVNLTGFTQIADVSGQGGVQSTFSYTDAVTGAAHTYTLWQNGDGTVKVAIESGLDTTIVP